jgi:hypothetical protein
VRLTARRYFGDRLDTATTTLGDLFKRALKRRAGDPLAAVARVDIEALDPPIRACWRFRFIGAPVLYTLKLLWVAVLTPPLRASLLIKDQSGVGAALVDAAVLVGTVHVRVSAREAFGIAAHAPAAAKDPVVAHHQFLERCPSRGIKGLCG